MSSLLCPSHSTTILTMDGRRLFPGTPEPRTKRRKEENAKDLIYPKTHRLFPKPTGPWVHSHDESTNKNKHKRSNPRKSHRRKTLPSIESKYHPELLYTLYSNEKESNRVHIGQLSLEFPAMTCQLPANSPTKPRQTTMRFQWFAR